MNAMVVMYNRATKAILLLRRLVDGQDITDEAREFIKDIDIADEARKNEERRKEEYRKKRETRGRRNSGKFEIEPRVVGGADWGADGLVLAKKGGTRLVWRAGSKYFSGVGQQSYAAARLQVLFPEQHSWKDIMEQYPDGKRRTLSAKLIFAHEEQIDSIFGKGTASKVAKLEGTVKL